MYEQPNPPIREKIRKDGPGPRGVPDCYYTSRQLDSTFRYVKFINKLRALEDETRKRNAINEEERVFNQYSEFFIKCDRKSLINNVSRRVDLCLASYEQDLQAKRERLKALLEEEEQLNIRKTVEMAQSGAAALWEEKMERLKYLLDKRKAESEAKYKDMPKMDFEFAAPCLVARRAKEAQEIQLYQMKEKEAKKKTEKEYDNMWHEIKMLESEALKARMEYDCIERYRRDMEAKEFSDREIADRNRKRELERERLKEEAKWFRAIWDEDIRKEKEKEQAMKDKRIQLGIDRKDYLRKRTLELEEERKRDKEIADTWDHLIAEAAVGDTRAADLRRRKRQDTDKCNSIIRDQKEGMGADDKAAEELCKEVMRKQQENTDKRTCEYLLWSQKTNRDVRKAMIDQIAERKEANEKLKKAMAEEDGYQAQVYNQLVEMNKYKEKVDAEKRKEHQRYLLAQIAENKKIKEAAIEEEFQARRDMIAASKKLDEEITKVACRPIMSEKVHAFKAQSMKVTKSEKDRCPCSQHGYCAK